MVLEDCGSSCGIEVETIPQYELLSREILIKMLKRETELRKSHETQILFDECTRKGQFVGDVIESLQIRVLEEFGFFPANDYLLAYLTTRARFPNDSEISNAAVYIKHDRSRQGDLRIGSLMPSLNIHQLSGDEVKLEDFSKNSDRPLIIMAASFT